MTFGLRIFNFALVCQEKLSGSCTRIFEKMLFLVLNNKILKNVVSTSNVGVVISFNFIKTYLSFLLMQCFITFHFFNRKFLWQFCGHLVHVRNSIRPLESYRPSSPNQLFSSWKIFFTFDQTRFFFSEFLSK